MNRLTYDEMQELFAIYDGPVPESAIQGIIARRDLPPTVHVVTNRELQDTIKLATRMAAQSRRNATTNSHLPNVARSHLADADRYEAQAMAASRQLAALTGQTSIAAE